MKVIVQRIALPHVNDLHPSIPLHSIGRALADHYGDPQFEDLPEHLSVLVVRLDEADEGDQALVRPVRVG